MAVARSLSIPRNLGILERSQGILGRKPGNMFCRGAWIKHTDVELNIRHFCTYPTLK